MAKSKRKKPAARRATKGRKKSDLKLPDPKAVKRRKVLAGLIAGKSKKQAALDAGHTSAMAENFKQKILPGLREEFQGELRNKVPNAKLIQRIVEGLNAKETKLTQFEGEFSDARHLVAFSERRRYVELACQLLGYLVEKVEIGGKDDGPVNFQLDVNFVDADAAS